MSVRFGLLHAKSASMARFLQTLVQTLGTHARRALMVSYPSQAASASEIAPNFAHLGRCGMSMESVRRVRLEPFSRCMYPLARANASPVPQAAMPLNQVPLPAYAVLGTRARHQIACRVTLASTRRMQDPRTAQTAAPARIPPL